MEASLRYSGQRCSGSEKVVGCLTHFCELDGCERVDPLGWIVSVVFCSPDSGPSNLAGEALEGKQLIVERRMLAGCFNATG